MKHPLQSAVSASSSPRSGFVSIGELARSLSGLGVTRLEQLRGAVDPEPLALTRERQMPLGREPAAVSHEADHLVARPRDLLHPGVARGLGQQPLRDEDPVEDPGAGRGRPVR